MINYEEAVTKANDHFKTQNRHISRLFRTDSNWIAISDKNNSNLGILSIAISIDLRTGGITPFSLNDTTNAETLKTAIPIALLFNYK